jgi:hypothetical protein
MDIYTQSSQKHFSLSGIIKLVYNCIQWKLNVWICSNAKANSVSCPIVAQKYVFARFETLKDLSADIRIQVFVYKFQSQGVFLSHFSFWLYRLTTFD